MKTIQKMLVGIAMMLLGIAVITCVRPENGATTDIIAVLIYIGIFLIAAGFFKVIYHRAMERDKEKGSDS